MALHRSCLKCHCLKQALVDVLAAVGIELENGYLDAGGNTSPFIPFFGTWLFNAGDPVNELDLSHLPFINFENILNPASDFGPPHSRTFSTDKHNGANVSDITTSSVRDARLMQLCDLFNMFIGKEKRPL